VLSLLDRIIASRARHRVLLNLGISPVQFSRMGTWTFLAPYAAVSVVAFGTGVVVLVTMVRPLVSGTPMPWAGIGVVALMALLVGMLGSATVRYLSSRAVVAERD
jgi:hypothetical protein